MAGWRLRARTVIRSERFEMQASRLVSDAKRCDEVLESVEWAVATNPEHHAKIPGTNLRLIKTSAFEAAGIPETRVYFTIDDNDTCTLQWIDALDQGSSES